MKNVRSSLLPARAGAALLLAAAAACAIAAEPAPARGPDAQEAQPAVSGDALQNLNRDDAASSPKPAPQAATPPSGQSNAQPNVQGAQTAAPRQGARADRLELDTTVVTGNRELPKVLYIVPWKKADLGDLPAQPFNTLLDEVLTPVDRDVFRREVTYYEAVSSGGDAGDATSALPAERSEK